MQENFRQFLDRLRQTAFLVPSLTLDLTDSRDVAAEPRRETFHFEGGISEFVEHLAPDAPVTDVWRLTGAGSFTETVPVLQATGAMVPTELSRDCQVDIALRWGTGYDAVFKSFVNLVFRMLKSESLRTSSVLRFSIW